MTAQSHQLVNGARMPSLGDSRAEAGQRLLQRDQQDVYEAAGPHFPVTTAHSCLLATGSP